MDDAPVDRIGPPPFVFEAAQPQRRVHAFSPFFRLLATGIVAGTGSWMFRLWSAGKLESVGWMIAAMAVIAWTWWHIQTSRTSLTSTHLHQTWMWDKKMELRELAYAKLIRVPGLDWLVAPRLYARTLLGKFAVFYAADKAMLAEFERLVRELQAFRRF